MRANKLLAILVLAAACLVAHAEMKVVQLVILKQARHAPELSESAMGSLMQQHLGFLENLWKTGKAKAVGPFSDGGDLRGVCILDMTRPEAKALMATEPSVKAGVTEPIVFPLYVDVAYYHHGPKFLDLEDYVFGFLLKGPNRPQITPDEAQKIQDGHMANIKKMAADDLLVSAGPFEGGDRYRGIFIFRNVDREKIIAATQQDPAIASGRLELKLYHWQVSKGTFMAPAKSTR